ncbi:Gldg family protein [Gabonibacter massiliensis]|uniref:Gldg family protein n=1 Tax=Gabonibacter massiliensis TaxID=1720195 RepID=UPI00073F6E85|nr:Gldg family protein [Gabonibacter massiliensis]
MKMIYKIARTELQTLFYSPIAWLILVLFAFQAAMLFAANMSNFVEYQTAGFGIGFVTFSVFANPWGGVLPEMQGYLYLYIPLLTMGLMSRELGSGSITLLYSSPVTNLQIILGKYLSMMIYGLVLIGVLFLFAVFGAFTIKDFDFPAIGAALLGLYLLICAYAAVGLFMSSLTSYQVVAAILTLTMLAFFNYVRGVWQGVELVREVTFWLGMSGRADEFVQGLICSEDLLYFIIVSALFLTLSVIRLKACRQKSLWMVTLGKYVGVLFLACFLGYLSSRPMLMTYYDATATKTNTLTENSQDVIARMKGGLTITTYVNLLDGDDLWNGLPENVKSDQERFKKYVRFKPEIEMKYVYYYDTIPGENWAKYYPGKNIDEIASELFRAYKLDSSLFLTPEQIREQVNLSAEGKVFVRLLERESGEKTFLRVYNDMQHFPGETEITAAFKRLAMELPKVGFLTGHGERDNRRVGDRDYNGFALDRKFRYALINQGFDVVDVNLSQEVPADIRIMVIAEMKSAMTDSEKANLDRYIVRGGNLLITTEPNRADAMNSLLAEFGVKQIPGTLVRMTENFSPTIVVVKPTREAADLVYWFNGMLRNEETVTMPGVSGLTYDSNAGYTFTPLFVSDSLTWNEVETTDFVDEVPVMNAKAGEIQQQYVTTLALSRKVGTKEQKIIIIGDADCISNGELNMQRKGIESNNFTIVMGGFFWMSDNEVPIDVRRPSAPDDKMYIGEKAMSVWDIAWRWIFPGLLVLASVFIWLRRRGR